MILLEEKQLKILRSFIRGREPRCSVKDFEELRKAVPICFQIESRFRYGFRTVSVLVPLHTYDDSIIKIGEYFCGRTICL